MDEDTITDMDLASEPVALEAAADEDRQSLILSLPVTVQVVLGTTAMPVSNLMKLGRGAVIKLNKRIGDPVDIMVSGRLVARGEIVMMDDADSRYGISLTEIVGASHNRLA